MEVTASNFKNVLLEVEKAINDCTFLSIDCELTGLDLIRNINAFDTPKQYYEKLRSNCKEFLVIQYGLSLFRYDEDKDVFKNQTYNFYVFRRPINRNIPDQRFLCQTSSINFLINEGFDFNKLFKQGISYLNVEEEEKYKNNLEEAYKKRLESKQTQQNGTHDIIPIPEDAQQFIDDIVQRIEMFLENDEVEIQLPKCNSFLRRLVYQIKGERFSDKISLETRQLDNKERVLFVTRLRTREEEEKKEKEKFEEHLRELEDFLGFTKVVRMIVNSGKLTIGHNLCLDLLHTLDKFLNPLPEEYAEFKELANSLFPKWLLVCPTRSSTRGSGHFVVSSPLLRGRDCKAEAVCHKHSSKILDTKYMSSMEPFKELISSNVLKHLLDTVSEKPFEIPIVEFEEEGLGYSLNDGKEHEAGYDAYITGLSFLSMWRYLGSTKGLKSKDVFSNFKLLKPYLNKVFLMVLMDNQYINLAGNDLNVTRDHVFYLTFPKEWKISNIMQLFSPFGNVYVSWLDNSSAYVSLYRRDQAAVALSTLSQSETYTITTFARRQALLAGLKNPLPSPIPRKRRSAEGQPAAKRRKTDSFNSSGSFSMSKRSIDPIVEEEQAEAEESTCSKKVFSEDIVWE